MDRFGRRRIASREKTGNQYDLMTEEMKFCFFLFVDKQNITSLSIKRPKENSVTQMGNVIQ